MSIAYGRMQDETEDGGYANVLKTGIAFKAWAFCLGLGYIYMDRRYLGKGMSMGEKQRTKLEEELMETDPGESVFRRKSLGFHLLTIHLDDKQTTHSSHGL
jgi:hypothetical protein